MKNILFVIHNLDAGGAQRSLVSLLNTLPPELYNIDLMVMNKTGLFVPLIPDNVNLIEPCIALKCLEISPTKLNFYLKVGLSWWIKKIVRWQLALRNKRIPPIRDLWSRWKKDVEPLGKSYDIAVGYIDGMPSEYVIDRVTAKRKIIWNHNDYTKNYPAPAFDRFYYESADGIATISEECEKILIETFPSVASDKIVVLENISNGNLIRKMSEENIKDSVFEKRSGKCLLSIGRLAEQKNYSLSLKAAAVLKDKIDFTWYIIGSGPLLSELESERDKLGLHDKVIFLGLRSNPYYYMRKADCIVMSSIFEGKSMVIDEAKILGCPIVSTNYPTVKDNITSGVNGLITDFTPESLANGIYKMLTDDNIKKYVMENLIINRDGNICEIKKYLDFFNKE